MDNKFWRPDIDPAREPLAVTIRREKLVDDRRAGRIIPIKIYTPEGAGPFPVILWSHGLGGGADGASFLSRFVASHGYVIVHVQHAGTDTSLWEGKPGHPWDVIRAQKIPRAAVLDRFADIPFVLDQLQKMTGLPALDYTRLGMSGHSFGALTTQVMAGQLYPDENDMLHSFREPRFSCGILYSPVPARYSGATEAYEAIELPLLHMTGTKDESPIEHFGYRDRLAVFEHGRAPDQQALILNDADHMVFTGSRGQLAENPHRKEQEEMIKIIALGYWDARLKSDTAAQEWLSGAGLLAYLAGRGEFRLGRE